MPAIPQTDFNKEKRRGNCFNFLFVQRYRQTPTNQIIIDSPRLYEYTQQLSPVHEKVVYTKEVSVSLSIILGWLEIGDFLHKNNITKNALHMLHTDHTSIHINRQKI